MRNLIGWCPETRQSIDLHLYVDDATLSRIWSKAVRFQCPHCGIKHETMVERLASRLFSHEPTKNRTGHQRAARLACEGKLTEGIMQPLSCRAGRLPSGTKIRHVAAP